ncbi:MAG TPA: CPBP family intramembrane glutamic endopeptidase [Pyrinomonadaceae bacterium]|nr:CPBP family intramembrane glutamic endopeptidase [Pyrinomonadaceae bacterium]
MFTEETSQQITPLSEQHAEPPVPTPEVKELSAREIRWLPWLEVVKALAIWTTSIGLLLFVPVIFAIPYIIYASVQAGKFYPEILTSTGVLFVSVAAIVPAHLLTLFVTRSILGEGKPYSFWKAIKFEWPEFAPPVIVTLISVLLAAVLLGFAYVVTTLYGGQKTDLDLLIESSMYTRVATAFVALATAPLVEEVIYRGVLYPAVEKAAGMGIAIAVVSLLFAGVHVLQYKNNISVIIMITMLSIVLTVARAVTGSMLPSFIIHLVFNGIQSVVIVASGLVDKDLLK